MANIGKLKQTEISTEMKRAYLDYAMSIIVSRALPDVKDGLKPVHRRILYGMHEMGVSHSAKFTKSAKIVGEVMGNFHPHGDAPIYDALVRLAQDFSMRYPLVEGQGNFGSLDGDPPAHMRYTEARMAEITAEMLFDIDKETVDFMPTFDNTKQEPLYLPAKLPNLLLMGSEGIAVGMATKIPPHNLSEIVAAIVAMIEKSKIIKINAKEIQLTSEITTEELLQFIKGPDFPTGGIIYDQNEIRNLYSTGKGKIVIRGKAEIEEGVNGKSVIIITELPYQVNKALLVARIADLVKEKKIEGIADLRDESDRHGLRVVVELKRDASPKKVLNNLFKHTSLQTSFPANVVALVNNKPQTLTLKIILEEYLKHRFTVITKRSEFELRQAKARLHILDGLKIATDHIDAVIKTIRESKDQEQAKVNLREKFSLSEIQAIAILDMQLRRLAALERQKIEDEIKLVKANIAYLEELLTNNVKVLELIKDEILKLKEKYADPRRTKVHKGKVDEFSDEDLIPNDPTVITITATGYIKRQNPNSFHTQSRGGKGIRGMTTKDEDDILHIKYALAHDNLLFFTNRGKVYQTKAFEIDETSRTSKGTAMVNLLNIESGEKVESFISYGKEEKGKFIFLATRNGTVKKSALSEFENIRKSGILTIRLEAGDELVWTNLTSGNDDIFLTTKDGKAIRFSEKNVRSTGRNSQGVRGIRISKQDELISMDLLASTEEKAQLLVLTERGLGKKTLAKEFRGQTRGGVGVKVAKINGKTGKVVFAQVIPENSTSIIITSKKGQIVKIDLSQIPKLSRATQGVILMRFSDPDEKIAAATFIEKD